MTMIESRKKTDRRKTFASTATKVVQQVTCAAGIVLVSQLLYIRITTPRLPPPPKSAHEFESDGLVVDWSLQNIEEETFIGEQNLKKREELCIILLGDSPVEGIGNETHHDALGGQTALAFSRQYNRPVRYWAYGKSGLTAAGIQNEMVPLMEGISKKYKIDVVIVSCGVNNVLSGQSPGEFGKDVDLLLDSICSVQNDRNCKSFEVLMLGLLDFSVMPFLPRPLNYVLGWRSRALRDEMENVINRRQDNQGIWTKMSSLQLKLSIATIPDMTEILEKGSQHPLLEHATNVGDQKLTRDDLFATDGFHPAKYGTTLAGTLLARTYSSG